VLSVNQWPAVLLLLAGAAAPAAAQGPMVTLEEAIARALRTQPSVVQARGGVGVSHAARRQAVGSWLPSITGTSAFAKTGDTRFNIFTATQSRVPFTNQYTAGLTTQLEVFDGFRRVSQGKAASALVSSADAVLVNQQFQVILQTKQAFFNALAAGELAEVTRA